MADTKVFLSGGRIQGRSDDTAIGTTPQTSWKFLKKETLDAAATTITVTDFAVKDNLMILYFAKDRSNRLNMHFGNTSLDPDIDVNGNYAVRRNYDYTYTSGGGDATDTSETDGIRVSDSDTGYNAFGYCRIKNIATKEKLVTGHTAEANTGGSNAPHSTDYTAKWTNTTYPINCVKITSNYGSGMSSGSEIVVLGCDDDEADTGTNFWQELAQVTLTAAGTMVTPNFSSTTKDYLWIESYVNASSSGSFGIQFNTDTGSGVTTYARMGNANSATSVEIRGSKNTMYPKGSNANTQPKISDIFLLNKDGTEKLGMMDYADRDPTGASARPDMSMNVVKWASDDQVEIVLVPNHDASLITRTVGSVIRVWGGTPT